MSADTARAYGLKSGDQLRIRLGPARTPSRWWRCSSQDEAARRASDSLLVADIATAQEWLGMLGRLSQIDLILPV